MQRPSLLHFYLAYVSSNPLSPATHSASLETVAVCGKLPVFPGVCVPKSEPQIGDWRKSGF